MSVWSNYNSIDKSSAFLQPTILQVIPSLGQGGAEKGTVEMAQGIIQKGGRAIVASSGGPLVSKLSHLGALHISLPLNLKDPATLINNIFRLKAIIHSHRIQIIHARSRAPAWSAFIAARLTHTPFITTFHGAYNFNNSIKKFYNSVMARGKPVIAISEFIRQHILEHYAAYLDSKDIVVIPRGVDLSVFNPLSPTLKERVQQLRTLWDIPSSAFPIFLLPARLTRWKGQTTALKTLSLLKDLNGLLIMLGDEQGRFSYKQELYQLAEELGVTQHIRIITHCNDMPAAYKLADLILHTSTDPEAFGRIIIEAQAMGRCVIASNHGAPLEIIEDNVTGFLVKPGCPDSLAEKIAHVLNLPTSTRENIEKAAREKTQAFYSKERMVSKTLELYEALLIAREKEL